MEVPVNAITSPILCPCYNGVMYESHNHLGGYMQIGH